MRNDTSPRLASPASSSASPSTTSLRRFRALGLLSASLALTALAACNEVETGRMNRVEFIPDDCGRLACDLDDRLAVGGVTDIYLDGVDGMPVDDLELVSSAPWVFDVVAGQPGTSPRFTVVGNGSGRADLLAIDRRGVVIDALSVDVVYIDDLDIEVTGSGVVSDQVLDYDEHFRIPADTRVDITVDPQADFGPVMGDVQYTVVIDAGLAAAIEPGGDVARGRFAIDAPAGEYDFSVIAPGGTRRTVRLSVE